MTCRFTTNGLSLTSANSFCKFISDYLYDTFKIKTQVSLEKTDLETLFVLKNKSIPSLCDFLTLEFSELILFDGRYYVGKGPIDEYIAASSGINITFFNWYIFSTEDVVLSRDDPRYQNLYFVSSVTDSVLDYIKSISGKFVFKGETGIVFSANIKDSYYSKKENLTDLYQTWVRNL